LASRHAFLLQAPGQDLDLNVEVKGVVLQEFAVLVGKGELELVQQRAVPVLQRARLVACARMGEEVLRSHPLRPF